MHSNTELHPDPDKRDWEYDGFGVRRYKNNFHVALESEICSICNKVKSTNQCDLFCCKKNTQ